MFDKVQNTPLRVTPLFVPFEVDFCKGIILRVVSVRITVSQCNEFMQYIFYTPQ